MTPASSWYTRDTLDALKRRHSLVDLATSYGIHLRRQGQAYVGLCPLHQEHTPSFFINPQRQRWRCYGCNQSGDILDLICRLEPGCTFPEAISRLNGSPLAPERLPPPTPRRPTLSSVTVTERQQVLDQVIAGYREELSRTPAAQAYLHQRGLDDATIAQLGIGYCSGTTPFPLFDRVRRAELSGHLLRALGVVTRTQHERLAGRIVFPALADTHGMWLVGRVIDDAQSPKYVGLPGEKALLGADLCVEGAEIVVVEGPMDYAVGRMWDIPTVAIVGTYPSPATIAQLRQTQRIYLALDNDLAGWTAAYALAPQLDDRAHLIVLPAKDLGELAQHPTGYARFLASWRQARPWHRGDGI